MKASLILIFTILTFFQLSGQNISPKIISDPISVNPPTERNTKLPLWLFPFKGEIDLAKAFDQTQEFANVSSLKATSINFSLDTSNTNSVYVEIVSIIPKNWCRISLGTQIAQTYLYDSTRTSAEIAYEKLINSGGNISLSFSRPIIYFPALGVGSNGFFILNASLTPYFDIEKLNHELYNPGAGIFISSDFDFRIINHSLTDRQPGNGFRLGLNGGWKYNAFNSKYGEKYSIDKKFDNLHIASIGAYIGFTAFDLSISKHFYNSKDVFFKEKSWSINFSINPVKL